MQTAITRAQRPQQLPLIQAMFPNWPTIRPDHSRVAILPETRTTASGLVVPDTTAESFIKRLSGGKEGKRLHKEMATALYCHDDGAEELLAGVCILDIPRNRQALNIFGADLAMHVAEISHLWLEQWAGANAASWFLRQSINQWQERVSHRFLLLAYMDPRIHLGTTFQALRFHYLGITRVFIPKGVKINPRYHKFGPYDGKRLYAVCLNDASEASRFIAQQLVLRSRPYPTRLEMPYIPQ